jgi:hypothetical protein
MKRLSRHVVGAGLVIVMGSSVVNAYARAPVQRDRPVYENQRGWKHSVPIVKQYFNVNKQPSASPAVVEHFARTVPRLTSLADLVAGQR